tara:strand:+ start:51 stop:866 length:816 start_codon:yes stop_codon:yes gene_type:complete
MSEIIVHKKNNTLIKWPHRVVDNFFSEEELSWVRNTFEDGLKDLQKRYPKFFKNGKMLPYDDIAIAFEKYHGGMPGKIINGFSCFIPFWDSGRIANPVNQVWREAIDLYEHKNNHNIKRKDYFTFLELNIYPAGLDYGWHMDTEYKSFTGVVYIGDEGQGTILKSGENQVTIKWKDNRGLLFMNCDKDRRMKKDEHDELSTWHKYSNTTDEIRYAVNFNMTHPHAVSMILSHIINRDRSAFLDSKIRDRKPIRFEPIQVALRVTPTKKGKK